MSYRNLAKRRVADARYRALNRDRINTNMRAWVAANREWLLYYRRFRYYFLEEGRRWPAAPEDHDDWCDDCGVRHTIEQRAALLRRLLPASVHAIRDAYPHIWGLPQDDDAGARKLYRDLRRIGAVPCGRDWALQGFGAVWDLPRAA